MFLFLCAAAVSFIAGCSSDPAEDNSPPNRPSAPVPADGSTGVPRALTVGWECSDPDGDPLRYAVQLFAGTSLEASVSNLSVKQWRIPDTLAAGTQYTWRVTAEEQTDRNRTVTGPTWSFTTGSSIDAAPNPPSAPIPGDGATGRPINTTLSWTCVDPDAGDTLSYSVRFGAFTPPPLVSTRQPQTYYNPGTLEYDTRYYWQITAYDETGDSTAGPRWMFDTAAHPGGEGVYSELIVERNVTWVSPALVRQDALIARFDSSYAPDDAIEPLRPAGVTCNSGLYQLSWDGVFSLFRYTQSPVTAFLTLGDSYEFDVAAGGGVPSLTESVAFPSCEPFVTYPVQSGGAPVTGFTCTWDGFECGGTVRLVILGVIGEPTGIDLVTANDGRYTFTQQELSAIMDVGYEHTLILIYQNSRHIDAAGFDPRSTIRGRVVNATKFYPFGG